VWYLSDDGDVIDEIELCSEQVMADFCELLDYLIMNPRDARLRVEPHMDPHWPGEGFTAPFGLTGAKLFYSLTPDIPTIRLQLVFWK
jgi:hypothetical protein